jgi:hypothetical protein
MTDRASPTRVDADRRAALAGAKLAALVTAHWGPGDRGHHVIGAATVLVGPAATGVGAGMTGAGGSGTVAWVLADRAPDRLLGPALVWAERHGIDDVRLLAEGPADAVAALARQAGLFAAPMPEVWAIEGTGLTRAVARPAAPRITAPAPPDLVDLLIDAGLEIVSEDGLVRGEVNGLEVARIVHTQTSAGVPIDEPQLEVGVGKADRELTAMVHRELAPVGQLARVVGIVRQHRRPGARRHPLNQLVPDRWLRAVLCRNPELVGLAALRPAEGPRPRPNLSAREVAIGVGEAADGAPVVVACSVGISFDLVPSAADARAAIDPAARLVLALPERDDHPGTRRLAARLRDPAEVRTLPGDWRAAG